MSQWKLRESSHLSADFGFLKGCVIQTSNVALIYIFEKVYFDLEFARQGHAHYLCPVTGTEPTSRFTFTDDRRTVIFDSILFTCFMFDSPYEYWPNIFVNCKV